MVTESLVGRRDLREKFMARRALTPVHASEGISKAINNLIEYPSAPGRQASSPSNWRLPDWADYQVQKIAAWGKSQ